VTAKGWRRLARLIRPSACSPFGDMICSRKYR